MTELRELLLDGSNTYDDIMAALGWGPERRQKLRDEAFKLRRSGAPVPMRRVPVTSGASIRSNAMPNRARPWLVTPKGRRIRELLATRLPYAAIREVLATEGYGDLAASTLRWTAQRLRRQGLAMPRRVHGNAARRA